MALETTPGEEEILARLQEIEGINVSAGTYLGDSVVPETDTNGFFVPYALVAFGGSYETRFNGIVGADKDLYRATFTVYVVSPDDTTSRMFRDAVRSKMLTDFRPSDGGPLRLNTGYSFQDADLGMNRYVYATGYAYYFNLDT